MVDLAQTLAIILVGKQILNNCQEIFVPKLISWLQNKKKKFLLHRGQQQWESDYMLLPYPGLFPEYLECGKYVIPYSITISRM